MTEPNKFPDQEFLDALEEFMHPRPAPSATIRVATFHSGDSLAPAIEAAGMDVVATLDVRSDRPDFTTMPAFDYVVANVPPDSPEAWQDSVNFLMRFLRVRRPAAFLIIDRTEDMLRMGLSAASRPFGYEVSLSRKDGLDFIAGVSLNYEQIALDALQEIVGKIQEKVAEGC